VISKWSFSIFRGDLIDRCYGSKRRGFNLPFDFASDVKIMSWQNFLNNLTQAVEDEKPVLSRECRCSKEDFLLSTRSRDETKLKTMGKCKNGCILADIISCKLELKKRCQSSQTSRKQANTSSFFT